MTDAQINRGDHDDSVTGFSQQIQMMFIPNSDVIAA
jgi:hypothetical protein